LFSEDCCRIVKIISWQPRIIADEKNSRVILSYRKVRKGTDEAGGKDFILGKKVIIKGRKNKLVMLHLRMDPRIF
jgi:hypothetical protein